MTCLRTVLLMMMAIGGGCSPRSVAPVAPARKSASAKTVADSASPPEPVDIQTLAQRELSELPALAPVAGRGWAARVAGRDMHTAPGIVGQSERFSFEFEESTRVECTVFDEPIDAGTYFGNVLEEVKKSLTVVGVHPTGFEVEQEIPVYFVSIRYQKQSDKGALAGQLKLALGLHDMRPVVCAHDVPGYTQTFEAVARTLFANYRVDGEEHPTATNISVAKVGEMPIGFTRDTIRDFADGRSVSLSISAEIVPRSAVEVMVSDEAEGLVIRGSKILEGHYFQSDLHGKRMDLKLTSDEGNRYRVAGKFGAKPLEADFVIKGGLPSPEATRLRLQRVVNKSQPFRFTQSEYHASLSPANAIDVQYFRTKDDPTRNVHVAIGQLEVLTTLDEHGNQVRSEMKVGPQTLVIERVYSRDDRGKQPSHRSDKGKERPK